MTLHSIFFFGNFLIQLMIYSPCVPFVINIVLFRIFHAPDLSQLLYRHRKVLYSD